MCSHGESMIVNFARSREWIIEGEREWLTVGLHAQRDGLLGHKSGANCETASPLGDYVEGGCPP